MAKYRVVRTAYNGMTWPEAEDCTMQEARNEVAKVILSKRKAGMIVGTLEEGERWEFAWEDQGTSDSEGWVSIRKQNCRTCKGEEEIPCDDCGGYGYVTCPVCEGKDSKDCDRCEGAGRVECKECEGTGSTSCPDCVE